MSEPNAREVLLRVLAIDPERGPNPATAIIQSYGDARVADKDRQVVELRDALRSALVHIDHMAAWISKRNGVYSFEGLGEDRPNLLAALKSPDCYAALTRAAHNPAEQGD